MQEPVQYSSPQLVQHPQLQPNPNQHLYTTPGNPITDEQDEARRRFWRILTGVGIVVAILLIAIGSHAVSLRTAGVQGSCCLPEGCEIEALERNSNLDRFNVRGSGLCNFSQAEIQGMGRACVEAFTVVVQSCQLHDERRHCVDENQGSIIVGVGVAEIIAGSLILAVSVSCIWNAVECYGLDEQGDFNSIKIQPTWGNWCSYCLSTLFWCGLFATFIVGIVFAGVSLDRYNTRLGQGRASGCDEIRNRTSTTRRHGDTSVHPRLRCDDPLNDIFWVTKAGGAGQCPFDHEPAYRMWWAVPNGGQRAQAGLGLALSILGLVGLGFVVLRVVVKCCRPAVPAQSQWAQPVEMATISPQQPPQQQPFAQPQHGVLVGNVFYPTAVQSPTVYPVVVAPQNQSGVIPIDAAQQQQQNSFQPADSSAVPAMLPPPAPSPYGYQLPPHPAPQQAFPKVEKGTV